MTTRILVVDDHQGTASMVGEVLRQQGHTVAIRLSLAAGIETLNGEKFDAVVTDLEMGNDAEAGLKLVRAAADKGIKSIALMSAVDASRIPLLERSVSELAGGMGKFFSKRQSDCMTAISSFVSGQDEQKAKG